MPNQPNEISLPFGFKVTFTCWEDQCDVHDSPYVAVLNVNAEDNAQCAPNGYAVQALISDGKLCIIPRYFYHINALAVVISLLGMHSDNVIRMIERQKR